MEVWMCILEGWSYEPVEHGWACLISYRFVLHPDRNLID